MDTVKIGGNLFEYIENADFLLKIRKKPWLKRLRLSRLPSFLFPRPHPTSLARLGAARRSPPPRSTRAWIALLLRSEARGAPLGTLRRS